MNQKNHSAQAFAVCLTLFAAAVFVFFVAMGSVNPRVATWTMLAFLNHAESETLLANYILNTHRDIDRGLALMREAGEHGSGGAQNFLGWWYDEHPSNKGNYDFAQAEYWYSKAAEQGIVTSIHNLGRVYEKTGRFDLVEAQFLKAAEMDWPNAQNSLGHWYYSNKNNKNGPDLEKAEYWFTKAAAADHDIALHSLGSLHRDRGEYDKAITFFEKSYEKGKKHNFNHAAQALAYFYHEGPAPEYHNHEKALHWYNELAKSGDADDLYEAAVYSLNTAGKGKENWKNPQSTQGMLWLKESADKGYGKAVRRMDRIWNYCFSVGGKYKNYGCHLMAAAGNQYAKIIGAPDDTTQSLRELFVDAVAGEAEAQLMLIDLMTRRFNNLKQERPDDPEIWTSKSLIILHNVFLHGRSKSRQQIPETFVQEYTQAMDDVMRRLIAHVGNDRAMEASACSRLYDSDRAAFVKCLFRDLEAEKEVEAEAARPAPALPGGIERPLPSNRDKSGTKREARPE